MLNREEKKIIFDALKGLAATFEVEKTVEVLQIYIKALSSYEAKDILSAIEWAISNCRFFPKPVELIEQINPKLTKADTDYIAGKIFVAITTYGGHYGQGTLARKELGEEAWKAVQFCGGWSRLCSSSDTNLTSLKAQVRDALTTTMDEKKIINNQQKRLMHTERIKALGITDHNIASDKVAVEIIDFEQKKKAALALVEKLT